MTTKINRPETYNTNGPKKDKRMQLFLSEGMHEAITKQAKKQGISASEVVREAVSRYLRYYE